MKTKINIKDKRGQYKIQQMAFMLIAVVLFFALVGIFIIAFNLSSLKETASLLEEKNAILLVSELANSPEFSCGNAFGGTRTNCVDFDKAMALKQDIKKYENFWGVENIEIRKISVGSSVSEREIQCNLGNYPQCNVLKLIEASSKGYDYSNFVALCRKENPLGIVYDKCELAKLTVRYKEVVE